MKILRLTLILVNFLLTGCLTWGVGSIDGYPTTQMRFVDLNEKKMVNTWIQLYDDDESSCNLEDFREKGKSVAVLNGIALDHGRKDMGMPLGETFSKDAKTEVLIRADRPLVFRMGYLNRSIYLNTGYVQGFTGSGVCLVLARFIPKPTHLYEATYEIKGNECNLQVFELVGNADTGKYQRVTEPSVQKVQCK